MDKFDRIANQKLKLDNRKNTIIKSFDNSELVDNYQIEHKDDNFFEPYTQIENKGFYIYSIDGFGSYYSFLGSTYTKALKGLKSFLVELNDGIVGSRVTSDWQVCKFIR